MIPSPTNMNLSSTNKDLSPTNKDPTPTITNPMLETQDGGLITTPDEVLSDGFYDIDLLKEALSQ